MGSSVAQPPDLSRCLRQQQLPLPEPGGRGHAFIYISPVGAKRAEPMSGQKDQPEPMSGQKDCGPEPQAGDRDGGQVSHGGRAGAKPSAQGAAGIKQE